MIYGYARVSTKEQNEIRQLFALKEAGVLEKDIYLDKQSGENFNRKNYKRLMRRLKADDVLYIKSIDRLGRNYTEILEQWRHITIEIGANIMVIDMPLLNTGKEIDLTGRLISDIVLQLLSYVAQTEREFIKQRQAEGIKAAKARGVRFGRPSIPVSPLIDEYAERYMKGEISSRIAGAELGVSHTTFLRWIKQIVN